MIPQPEPPPLSVALWRCAVALRQQKMRDRNGNLMWTKFVALAAEASNLEDRNVDIVKAIRETL